MNLSTYQFGVWQNSRLNLDLKKLSVVLYGLILQNFYLGMIFINKQNIVTIQFFIINNPCSYTQFGTYIYEYD